MAKAIQNDNVLSADWLNAECRVVSAECYFPTSFCFSKMLTSRSTQA
jgi:hypothetical protein